MFRAPCVPWALCVFNLASPASSFCALSMLSLLCLFCAFCARCARYALCTLYKFNVLYAFCVFYAFRSPCAPWTLRTRPTLSAPKIANKSCPKPNSKYTGLISSDYTKWSTKTPEKRPRTSPFSTTAAYRFISPSKSLSTGYTNPCTRAGTPRTSSTSSSNAASGVKAFWTSEKPSA